MDVVSSDVSKRFEISDSDFETLRFACAKLEHPSLIIRLSAALGTPVETLGQQIGKAAPPEVAAAINRAARQAITLVLENTARTMKSGESLPAKPRAHAMAAMTTGAVAGFFGLQGLLLELPVTTGIMFRSIADIARSEGEAPDDPETLLNCMQVFAMGSSASKSDDAAETSYYAARLMLGKAISDAVQHVAARGIQRGAGAPALLRFIAAIANRFGLVVSQKALAQTVPIIGAVGGGVVNTMFITHFQEVARGHFSIRRLERKYGEQPVKDAYQHAIALSRVRSESSGQNGRRGA